MFRRASHIVVACRHILAYTGAYTMPTHPRKLTDSEARKIVPPASSYAIHWCPRTPGFGLRITANDARAWIAERRVDGKTVRRTLGAAAGRGAISGETARSLQIDVSSELQQGVDRLEIKRERRAAEKIEGETFGEALRDYVKNKRRRKDGLALKPRTKADYLAMIEPAGVLKNGAPTLPGALYTLAGMSLARLDADAIRDTYKALAPRGERQQSYAMQVLRAVLRHHGVSITDNPLSPTTAGKERVTIAPSRGKPSPIPADRLGAWWKAARAIDTPSADMLRFMVLTGCRPGEAQSITVGAVDLSSARARLQDTKNRLDHDLLLSTHALAIAKKHAKGKVPSLPLFGVASTPKTLAAINTVAGTPGVTPHKLRHTFASVAAQLVPVYTLKRLLNHIPQNDVTDGYVEVSEAQLRAGWQAVDDHIAKSK